MKILVTGSAGFIGFHLCNFLLKKKSNKIFGIDNINSFYDIGLKRDRLKILNKNRNFKFYKIDIKNITDLKKNFNKNKYHVVINLAAQAGVRHSIMNPKDYLNNNILGFYNIISLSKDSKVRHFIYASTSSVYGESKEFPLDEDTDTSRPLSFYAASKKCNEVMAHSFSNIYKLPCTGLRFFTVYGSYGRPDMALYKFTKSIMENKSIELYNKGNHIRDFTYIDDVVKYIANIINIIPKKTIPHEIFNVGSNQPQTLRYFLKLLFKLTNKKTNVKLVKLQTGDVLKTHADNKKIVKHVKKYYYTSIEHGMQKFIDWFRNYYQNGK